MPQRKAPRRTKRFDGEGSVYPEAPGWRCELMVGGRTYRRRAATEREAYAKLETLRAAHGMGLPASAGTDKVGDYLRWWLSRQEAKVGTGAGDKSVNTVINYRWALAPVIEAHGHRQLVALEPTHVEAVLDAMAAQGKARESIKRVKSILGQALKTAEGRGMVHRNVARLAELPATRPPAERRSLTVEQATRLLDAAKGTPVEAFIITGLNLGLRPGELLGLRWVDVDLEAATLDVTGSLKREGGTLRRGDVKRGIRASRRRLDLPPHVAEALRAHRQRQRQQRLIAGPEWQEHGLVFPSEVGTPVHSSNMNRHLQRVTERAGLGKWSMTELARHSAASILSAEGVPLEVVADILGHSSTRMLERHYRHQVRPSVGAHVAVMTDLFGNA